MVSRATRVYLGGFAVGIVLFALITIAPVDTSDVTYPYLVVPGATVILPQLYLAARPGDDPVSPRTRLRFALGVAAYFLLAAVAVGTGADSLLVWALAVAVLVALLLPEARRAYRQTMRDEGAAGE